MAHLTLARREETQVSPSSSSKSDCANGLNKSLDASGIESCPHTDALFLESGRWDPVLRSEGRVRPPRVATLHSRENKTWVEPIWNVPRFLPPKNRSRLLLDHLHRFVTLRSASAWVAATEGGGKG